MKFLNPLDKKILKIHVHQIDNESSFWRYIEQIAISAYEKGVKSKNKKAVKK